MAQYCWQIVFGESGCGLTVLLRMSIRGILTQGKLLITVLHDKSRLKSFKLYWNEKTLGSGDALTLLFGDRRETLKAAKLAITRMKQAPTLSMTKREMRFFAKELATGKLGVKYSYHNFYTKLLRKLLDMGFIEKDVLIWDQKRRKTVAVYQLRLQPIPERAPQSGFVKQAWQIARGWNELVQS